MNIDFYCFVMETLEQKDYRGMHAKHKSAIFQNLDFDIEVAKSINKFAVYIKQTGKFYDKDCKELDLSDKMVFPRCIIPELSNLLTALEHSGAKLVTTAQDYQTVMQWPRHIKPRYREIEETTYGEFLKNFETYKAKFGRVFFKTKNKNISCEVVDVACLSNLKLASLTSDDDLGSDTLDEFESFFSKPIYTVFTNQSKSYNDSRFAFLSESTPVYVGRFVEIVKDQEFSHVPVEYRSFVVDGKFVTSRSWVPNRSVPEEVKKTTQLVIDAMPQNMNKTFVVDVLEFEDKTGKHFDLCELNPISCSGYEQGSTIFLLEDTLDNKRKYYPKYDSIDTPEKTF